MKKLSDLPLTSYANGTERLLVIQDGETKTLPVSEVEGPRGQQGEPGSSGVSYQYFETIAEGVASVAVPGSFASAETGVLRAYKRIAAAPYYEDLGDSASPLAAIDHLRLTRGRIENKAALRNLFAELYINRPSLTPRLFGVVTCGDSVSPYVGSHLTYDIAGQYEAGGMVYPGQWSSVERTSLTILYASTGTIIQDVEASPSAPSFSYLPNNKHIVMADGATLTFRAQNSQSKFTRILAWLAKRPGDGSALLEVRKVSDSSVVASWNTGSLDGMDGTLVKANAGAHFTGLDEKTAYELKVTATGTVCFLTCVFTTNSGAILYQAGRGGSSVAQQQAALTSACWQGIMADLNTRLMVFEDKSENNGASYSAMMDAWAAMPNIACLFLGTHPSSATATEPGYSTAKAISATLRKEALAHDFAYFNAFDAWGSWAEVNRMGFGNDGTHLLTNAYWVTAKMIASQLGLIDTRQPLISDSRLQATEFWLNETQGAGGAKKGNKFASKEVGIYRADRVSLLNIGDIRLKTDQTAAGDEVTGQLLIQGYSNAGFHFSRPDGLPGSLHNVNYVVMGGGAVNANSTASMTPDYNNQRVTFNMQGAAGSTAAPRIVCGGLRIGSVNMLTTQQPAIASPTADVAALKTFADTVRAVLTAHGMTA